MHREMVVGGQFYPSNCTELEQMITSFTPEVSKKINAMGAIVPHAGYVFSGEVCGNTLTQIEPKQTYIVLGTNHTGRGEDFAIEKWDWRTPSGTVQTNKELVEKISEASDIIKVDSIAHKYEHSIEVQMPFIKKINENATVVAISISNAPLNVFEQIADDLVKVIEMDNDICILASSDMDHYETQNIVQEKDMGAIKKILELDTKGFLEIVMEQDISICGYAPIAVLLEIMKRQKVKQTKLIKHQTSGDVSGDFSSVVGYAGMIFY